MSQSPGSSNGQWKWIAGILAALMVGFLPGYIANRNAPSSGDFEEMQKAQQSTQLRMAVIATQLERVLKTAEESRKRIIAVQLKQNGGG
jgi:hypothetical protein